MQSISIETRSGRLRPIVISILACHNAGLLEKIMPVAEEIQIEFPESGPSRAGQLADDLTSRIRELDETATVAISRASSDAMDLGTILTIVLGAAPVAALARGLGDWIRKQGDPTIRIKRGKEEIVIQGGLSADQKFELVKLALEKSK
jgi:hypothetical protein